MPSSRVAKIQAIVDGYTNGGSHPIRVLEAGCGSARRLRFNLDWYIVGMDISAKQLERNPSLSAKVQGDIQALAFEPTSFHIIVCWDVLEHIQDPRAALSGFLQTTRKNGLIVLALPNVLSIKGLVAKYTPHWFHNLFYRFFSGVENPGEDDTGPFKTFLGYSISPVSLKKFAKVNGLSIEYFGTEDIKDKAYLKKRTILYLFYCFIRKASEVLSLGRLGDSDFGVVLRVP